MIVSRSSRVFSTVVAVTLVATPWTSAFAHPDHPDNNTGRIASLNLDGGATEAQALLNMPDSLATALTGPCPDESPDTCIPVSASRVCTLAPRNDVTSKTAPADATQWQVIFFVPKDRPQTRTWDRGTGCNDGAKSESTIGYSIHNTRAFMSGNRPSTSQGNRVVGNSFRQRRKNVTLQGRTFSFYDVMFMRGANNDSYYATSRPFDRLRNELDRKGYSRLHVKYMLYADVRSTTTAAGHAELNGNQGAIYWRSTSNSTHYYRNWGCADQGGDVPTFL